MPPTEACCLTEVLVEIGQTNHWEKVVWAQVVPFYLDILPLETDINTNTSPSTVQAHNKILDGAPVSPIN